MNKKLIYILLLILVILSFQYASLEKEMLVKNNRLFNYSVDELFYLYNYYMRNKTVDFRELHQQMLHSEITLHNYANSTHKTFFTKNFNKVVQKISETITKVVESKSLDSTQKREQFFKEIFQLYNYTESIYDQDKRDISNLELKGIITKLNEISDLLQ